MAARESLQEFPGRIPPRKKKDESTPKPQKKSRVSLFIKQKFNFIYLLFLNNCQSASVRNTPFLNLHLNNRSNRRKKKTTTTNIRNMFNISDSNQHLNSKSKKPINKNSPSFSIVMH